MAEATPAPTIFEMDPNAIIDTDDLPASPEDTLPPESQPAPATPDDPDYNVPMPDDLPPELAERWEAERKKHQRNYSKQLDRLRNDRKDLEQYKQKATLVDRFYTDPQYAAQTITQMAQQLGYTLTRTGQPGNGTTPHVGTPGTGTTPTGADVPPEIARAAQEAVADNPDLAFLAPVIAKAAWTISQAATKPLHEEAQARKAADTARYQSERQAEFARMTQELEEEGVDWREHEDEMMDRLKFLQDAVAGKGGWTHPKYGNFLRMLHQWTVGPRAAQAEAGKRLQQAMQQRTSTGTPARSPGVNVDELIRAAPNDAARWRIAFQHAVSEVPTRR